jgi:hypothetical protein
MKRISTIFVVAIMLAMSVAPGASVSASISSSASNEGTIAATPSAASTSGGGVLFVENAGQWDEGARFQVWGGGAGTTWLAEDAQWITVVEPADEASDIDRLEAMADPVRMAAADTERAAVNLRLSFVDANPAPAMEPFGAVETNISYFIGADPDAWQVGVPVWSGVRYVDLYPGLDLEVTSENGQFVRRLVVKDDAGVVALTAI